VRSDDRSRGPADPPDHLIGACFHRFVRHIHNVEPTTSAYREGNAKLFFDMDWVSIGRSCRHPKLSTPLAAKCQ